MSRLQLLALVFGCLLLAAPLCRAADEEEYDDELDEEEEAGEGEEKEGAADEKDVVVLTDDNFDDKLKDVEFALVRQKNSHVSQYRMRFFFFLLLVRCGFSYLYRIDNHLCIYIFFFGCLGFCM